MMTGFAIATYGLLASRTRPVAGGVWLGFGTGVGFLAKGLLVPGVIGVTALLLPLFAAWRSRAYARSLGIAFVVALPFLLLWPIALYLRDPQQFYVWFWLNNVGRYLGFSVSTLGAGNEPGFWPKTLPWFGFPSLYLAMASVWQRRHALRTDAALQLGLVGFGVYLLVLLTAASARQSYGLPLLVALALLAAPHTATLSPVWSRRIDWGARALFGTIALLLWGVWISMVVTHHAPHWPVLTRVLPVAFDPPLQAVALTFALLGTAGWLAAWRWLPRLHERAILSLALVATLWLPWLNYAKSYRSVFVAMQPHLPRTPGCVASIDLGESERGMLDYFLGIRTEHREVVAQTRCPALLVEGEAQLDAGWTPVWNGARPEDTHEHFRLYLRRP
jgi:4-amino-4-deoxy-L-arabinose transferase-like glycosyltransferase